MKKHTPFNATTLRTILIVTVVAAFLLAGAGFYFAYGWIKDYATTVNQSVVSAHDSSSGSTTTSTKDLQAFVQQNAGVTPLVNQLYAPQASYVSQAIQDINTYARLSKLGVSNVDSGTTATASSAPSPTSTAPKASLSAGGNTPITVTLTAPVSYTSLLKFMTYVEHSLPKMQIQGLTIQGSTDSPNDVQITDLTIGVTTR